MSSWLFVLKVLPHNNMLFLSAKEMKVYNREIATYRDLHSMVREIRSKAGVRDDEIPICAPDFYHSFLDEVGESGANGTMVVLQDLKQLGFRMVDKKGKDELCSGQRCEEKPKSKAESQHSRT